jgi:hypothetical protein
MPITAPPTITALPTPPDPNDRSTFNSRAYPWSVAQQTFGTEVGSVATNVYNNALEAQDQAGIATAKAAEAAGSAAEALAQASGTVATGSAKDWATKVDAEVVAGQGFGAKKYADDAALSAAAAAASALEAAGLVEKYQGALAADPTLDKDGNPLTAGDWYINTTTGYIRVYNGSAWVQGISVVAGVSSLNGLVGDLTGFVTETGAQALSNKTLTDPKLLLGGTNGTEGQVPISQGAGLPPVWGDIDSTLKTGDILLTAGTLTAPDWLPANGTIYLQSSYQALFATVGLLVDPRPPWTQRTSSFGTTTIYGVTYGNDLYVAVGASGQLATSPDGINWTQRTSSFGTTIIFGVTYGNGLFVAVGDSGQLATSPDGINWTQRASSFGTTTIYEVTYGNGLYVAVGNSGQLATLSLTYDRATQFITPIVENVGVGVRAYVKT